MPYTATNACKKRFKLGYNTIFPVLENYPSRELKPTFWRTLCRYWNCSAAVNIEIWYLKNRIKLVNQQCFHIIWCFYHWLNTRSWTGCFCGLKRLMLIAGKFFLKAWNGKTEILFISFKCYLYDRVGIISINLCSVTGYVMSKTQNHHW